MSILPWRCTTDSAADEDWTATLGVQLGDRAYAARVAGGRMDVTSGPPEHADATIETDPSTFVALLTGQQRLDRSGAAVGGDRRTVQKLIASCR
jgi:putative sterol carrier protein